MKVIITILFFVSLSCSAFGQNSNISKSHKNELKKASVAEKSIIYDELAQSYFGIKYDSVLYYAEKNIELGKKYNYKRALAIGLIQKGIAYSNSGFPEEALDYLSEGIKLRQETGDFELIAGAQLDIGNAYQRIGVSSEDAGEFDKAEENFALAKKSYDKANQIALLSGDSLIIAKSFLNLASANYFLYDYEKAIETYRVSYSWYPNEKKDFYKGEIDMNIASCLIELDSIDSAKTIYDNAIDLLKKHHRYEQWASANITIASIYEDSDIDYSIRLYLEADSVAKIVDSRLYQSRANLGLYEIFEAKKDYRKALKFFENYTRLRSQVSNVAYDTKVRVLQLKYDNEKTNKELLEQRRKREREETRGKFLVIGIISLSGVILVLIILFFQRIRINHLQRKRLKDGHDQAINDLIKNQELETIEAVLTGQESERKRIAEDLHDRLGSSLSAVRMYFEAATDNNGVDKTQLGKAYELLDNTIEDTRGIANNLITGTLSKFGLFAALEDLKNTIEGTGKVKVHFDFQAKEERFRKDFEINIYRIIQEAFSNSLKHANPSQLSAEFSQKEDVILIQIRDNGSGFDESLIESGMGLKNIKARVLKLGGDLLLESHPGRGTSYEIQLKLAKNDETDYS